MTSDRANSIKFINQQYIRGSRELKAPPALIPSDGLFSHNTKIGGRDSYAMSNEFGRPIGVGDSGTDFVKKTQSQLDVDSLQGMLFRNSKNVEQPDPIAANRISDYRIDPTAPKADAPREHFSLLRNTIETEPPKQPNIKKTASPLIIQPPIALPVMQVEKINSMTQKPTNSVPIVDRNLIGLPIWMWIVLIVLLFSVVATVFVAVKTKHEHQWITRRGFIPTIPVQTN